MLDFFIGNEPKWTKSTHRSSSPQTFFKIDVLKNFTMFTGKHPCWSLFLIKLTKFFIIKRLQHSCFLFNIAKFSRTPFFTEHLRTTASVLTSSACHHCTKNLTFHFRTHQSMNLTRNNWDVYKNSQCFIRKAFQLGSLFNYCNWFQKQPPKVLVKKRCS